jgi:hypothetical protein
MVKHLWWLDAKTADESLAKKSLRALIDKASVKEQGFEISLKSDAKTINGGKPQRRINSPSTKRLRRSSVISRCLRPDDKLPKEASSRRNAMLVLAVVSPHLFAHDPCSFSARSNARRRPTGRQRVAT